MIAIKILYNTEHQAWRRCTRWWNHKLDLPFGRNVPRWKIKISAAWIENAYVEGDRVGSRVVLGQLEGGAKKVVEVLVWGHKPGTCAQRTTAKLSQGSCQRQEWGHGILVAARFAGSPRGRAAMTLHRRKLEDRNREEATSGRMAAKNWINSERKNGQTSIFALPARGWLPGRSPQGGTSLHCVPYEGRKEHKSPWSTSSHHKWKAKTWINQRTTQKEDKTKEG